MFCQTNVRTMPGDQSGSELKGAEGEVEGKEPGAKETNENRIVNCFNEGS